MRLLKTGLAATAAAMLISAVTARASAQAAATPEAANRIVCAQEGAALVNDLRLEIKASGQQTWTPAQERQRQVADLKQVLSVSAAERKQFDANFAENWKLSEDFIQKPEMVLAACAVTLVNAWEAGVRDVAQLKQKWAQARYSIYKLPGAMVPAANAPKNTPAAPAKPPAKPAVPDPNADPYAGAPVDCVRLNDTPGSFKNVCDFAVYFTYCGVNPAKDSWVAECSKQSYGLLDIGARGVQGGFTGAETIYMFACKSPKTPKDVKFDGAALRGWCK